ncbi:MAG: carboxymuconolactone decarboxylase family protein [Zhengella sp.]|uniref:carboxymuconolactone decarboxylase family protein n=1 Tax=Zhengella sp. TaxID=2282762 RepID=UPI001DA2325C|nr:carboxymuconolactone decarboxylase family protein [Notoacmeibacter sp.]MCC0025718.1 carboxymuconolactone decarboxylase family protein [Brucellaceae bacterium]
MSTVRLVSYEEADAAVRVVYDDIRATRGSDFINNFWLALAADPALLKSTWEEVKAVMTAPGPLDPLTREMIYIAVSAANGCTYCAHSHTASAKAKGMTDAQYGDLLKVIALAGKTNHLANALQVPVDAAFEKSGA